MDDSLGASVYSKECYAVFFAIYLVFYRHEKAIAYLILLLFGLYLGKKIAIRANRYIVDQANKKNTP